MIEYHTLKLLSKASWYQSFCSRVSAHPHSRVRNIPQSSLCWVRQPSVALIDLHRAPSPSSSVAVSLRLRRQPSAVALRRLPSAQSPSSSVAVSLQSSALSRRLRQSSGMIVTSALIIWKGLMCVTGSESPVVVVLSGSMEPGFKRGDILFLHMSKDPIRAGEIVVFNVDGRKIPIVHRVIKVHESEDTGEVDVLTKGDNNFGDDRLLYAHGELWLHRHHIMGRAVGFLPYVGWVTIIMTEKPIIKYLLIGALGLVVITSKE